jgi:transposase
MERAAMKNNTIIETIGCDLGDKQSELCLLTEDGTAVRLKPVKTSQAAMRAFFMRAPAHVIIEVGAHSRWVSELLRELGHTVTIANPRRVELISKNHSKSDVTDAELLARLGRSDRSLLSPVEHRGNEVQADLAVAKARDGLVACRTKVINSIRGMVKSFGGRLPSVSSESFHTKAAPLIPEPLKAAVDPLIETVGHLNDQIKKYDRQIAKLGKKYVDVEVVSQPKGVGVLTALVFILTIENKERFRSSRMAGAFVGLRPRKDQSGNCDKQLRITKTGDPHLRRLLVISANYVLGPFGQDSDLRRWGLELAKRGGKNAKKRATVAVARKLAVLMHRLWTTGEEYVPLGYAQKRRELQTAAA